MSIALFALAPRAKSRDELFKQLLKRGVESETANAVLDSLELQGLLNDLEFAKLWSESRQRSKKLSKRVIATELRGKGVAQDIITEVIEEIDDETEYAQAFLLAERKYRSISHLDPEVSLEIMELFRQLTLQGTSIIMASHDYHTIQRVPGKILKCDGGTITPANSL